MEDPPALRRPRVPARAPSAVPEPSTGRPGSGFRDLTSPSGTSGPIDAQRCHSSSQRQTTVMRHHGSGFICKHPPLPRGGPAAGVGGQSVTSILTCRNLAEKPFHALEPAAQSGRCPTVHRSVFGPGASQAGSSGSRKPSRCRRSAGRRSPTGTRRRRPRGRRTDRPPARRSGCRPNGRCRCRSCRPSPVCRRAS